ncbi:MAG: PilZ domain-containing protein [Desulfobulbaceae bacterium]|nr:PilZ domain-containing protein [Desulfobulbaceae bacterium]HIJ89519.1 PilZ domain-containing protein [Deltaproteobacteria bacterium]
MAEKKVQKVFVKEDNCAKIRCYTCGLIKTVRLQDAAKISPEIKVRCVCTAVFLVRFEYRKFYRKATNLEGTYHVLFDGRDIPDFSQAKKTTNCRIENISMHGAGFSTLGRHRIEKNGRLILAFTLDNPHKTWIEKTGVVQLVEGSYIGMRFDEPATTDKALGFYLMP